MIATKIGAWQRMKLPAADCPCSSLTKTGRATGLATQLIFSLQKEPLPLHSRNSTTNLRPCLRRRYICRHGLGAAGCAPVYQRPESFLGKMKVLFYHLTPFALAHGGLQIQIAQTREALRRIGVEVEFFRWYDDIQDYDVLHFFGRIPTGSSGPIARERDKSSSFRPARRSSQTINKRIVASANIDPQPEKNAAGFPPFHVRLGWLQTGRCLCRFEPGRSTFNVLPF